MSQLVVRAGKLFAHNERGQGWVSNPVLSHDASLLVLSPPPGFLCLTQTHTHTHTPRHLTKLFPTPGSVTSLMPHNHRHTSSGVKLPLPFLVDLAASPSLSSQSQHVLLQHIYSSPLYSSYFMYFLSRGEEKR